MELTWVGLSSVITVVDKIKLLYPNVVHSLILQTYSILWDGQRYGRLHVDSNQFTLKLRVFLNVWSGPNFISMQEEGDKIEGRFIFADFGDDFRNPRASEYDACSKTEEEE